MTLYSIGLSALSAAQLGISTTGHNITNSSSTSYHRQSITQTSQTPQLTGSGFVGAGTMVTNITRSYNDFLDSQVRTVSGEASYLSTYLSQISQVNDLISSDNSISTGLSTFYNALSSVASTPASVSSRQSFLSSTEALVNQFNTMAERLNDLYSGADQRIQDSVAQINSYTSQIAKLNASIVRIESTSGNQQANDLHDQRDALVNELNKIIQVDVTEDSSGFFNITTGNGQSLVVGTTANEVTSKRSASNPQKSDIYLSNGASDILLDSTSLSGGSLGALIDYRDVTVTNARNELGKEAMVLANAFNEQHKLGQDLNGNLGTDLFSISSPSVYSNSNNVSTAALTATVSDYSSLQASDYKVGFDGTNYNVTRMSDNTVSSFTGSSFTLDGIDFSLSATPTAGDSYLVQPTVSGATNLSALISDTAKVAAGLPLTATAGTSNTGTSTLTLNSIDSATLSDSAFPAYGSTSAMRTFTYSGGAFTSSDSGDTITLSGNTVSVALSSGGSMSFTLSGTPSSGDTFTVGRNNSGTADSRNANLLGKLATAKLTNNGTATITESYAQLVSSVGTKTSQLDTEYTSQTTLLDSVTTAQQSFSGVNLDEEAANLIQYQQAYQAAARILTTAQKMLDDIFSLMS